MPYSPFSSAFRTLIAEGGICALWRGNAVNVLKNGPETALRFGFHGKLKDVLYPGAKELSAPQRLLVACLAGAGSLTLTYPMEVRFVSLSCYIHKSIQFTRL